MSNHKIAAYPDLTGFGPDAVRAGDRLAEARGESFEAAEAVRMLSSIDHEHLADSRDSALADEAFKEGRPAPGTPHADQLKADRQLAEARLRAAQAAEDRADAELYRLLKENVARAAQHADQALEALAEDHRQAIDAVVASRARLLEAESSRRFVDGVAAAIEFDRGNPSGRHESSRGDFVWPLSPLARPPVRNGNFVRPSRVDTAKIDAGITAMKEEVPLVFVRPDHEQVAAQAEQIAGTPLSERQFSSQTPRTRRRRAS